MACIKYIMKKVYILTLTGLMTCLFVAILRGKHDKINVDLFSKYLQYLEKNATAERFINQSEVTVLCWVMTSPENLDTKGNAVLRTWGRRCDKFVFASDYDDPDHPTLNITVEHGREHLTAKTMKAFDAIWREHRGYDWYLKADDDTYVIMENLKYFLSSNKPSEKIFFGHHFTPYVDQGYFSGGAGYVVSRAALEAYSRRNETDCARDTGPEDIQFGRCMETLGVAAGETRDSLGRTRFHCFDLHTILNVGMLMRGSWYQNYTKYWSDGDQTLSDYPVSFHYVSPKMMQEMDFLIYRLKAFGLRRDEPWSRIQMNNPPPEPEGNSAHNRV